jgi:hypothetical protein
MLTKRVPETSQNITTSERKQATSNENNFPKLQPIPSPVLEKRKQENTVKLFGL